MMLKSAEGLPVNTVLLGKGNSSSALAMEEQLRAGAAGLKVHEDWGYSYSSAPETATVRSQTRTVEAPSRSRLEIIAPVSQRDAVLAVLHSSDRVTHAFSQQVHYDS
ncbi:hypothetical protein [Gordonia iterans]